ncbi:hypothetical protein IFR05_012446 [Cadophora sp. M221]|nr:hypothetical protein IFR05_012446 [Cadophora sp. M221]
MRTAQLGVLASLGIGVFVANAQGTGWEIKRQPWGSSTQQWSESGQWSEEWKWTADQKLPVAPGSAWQFSQSSTVAPPLPPGASSQGRWTWIPSPSSQGGFFWSYSSSPSPSTSQGLGIAPGTPWQFSQSSTTPPPVPAGFSVGSWKWISGPSGGYYWSFIPGPKQDLPTPPGTAWQFSQSSIVAPPLPAGAGSGAWKWISAPSDYCLNSPRFLSTMIDPKQGGGYYWSFIPAQKQNLPPAPGTEWIFSTSSTTAPPLPAGVSGSGSWKWVSSPDGKGYYWSYISSGGQTTPQQKLPEIPTGGSGWIFSTSSTTPPPVPAGASTSGSWKWVSSPDGKGYYWSYISSPATQVPAQKLPEPPIGGTGWIFSTSSTVAPALPVGVSGTGAWKWVSSPDGKGYYWSFIPAPQTPQPQLPQPSSGSTEWIFSPSKTTPPTLPPGISGTAGSWKWVSSPSGEGYYWSFTPSIPSTQQLPAPKPGSTGWIFSESKTEPPKISGITGSGSWTWISSGSGKGYYWTWSPGAPQGVPSGYQGGVVTPGSGTTGQQIPGQQGGFPQPGQQGGSPQVQPGQQGGFPQPGQQGGFPQVQPGQQGGVPVIPGQQGGFPQVQPGQQGGVPVIPGQQGQQGGVPVIPGQQGSFPQPGTQGSGNIPIQGGGIPQGGTQPHTGDQGQIPAKGPFEGSFDQTGHRIQGGGIPSTQPGTQGSGNIPTQGGDIPHGGQQQPQTGDQGQIPIFKEPFGGSFDHTGKPADTTGGSIPSQQVHPSTGDQGQVPIKVPFGGSFDQTGKPIEQGGSTGGSHSSGGVPVQHPGTTGEIPTHGIPQTGGTGSTPGTGEGSVINPPFGGSFDHTGKPVDTHPIQGGGSTQGSHSSGGVPVQHPGTTGEIPLHPGTGGTGSIPGTGEGTVVNPPFGGSFDHTGKPVDTHPIQGGGSTGGSHSTGGIPVQQPGTTGETPITPHTGGEGSVPSTGTEEDVAKGPFGGFFDKTGKPIGTGSQGTYTCPPRSRIELLDAPTVPGAVCPDSQDRRYSAGVGKDFYILCCRHVDGGKKEIAVIPDIPSLQYCIHICAGTANCKSVLYTARQGYNSNYPVKSCQLFEHGDYGVQTPCNNDAHDSAYLIEPPTGTTDQIPPPPPISGPPISPPLQVDIPPSIMLPPGISEQCVQNVLAAIKCGTCASC